MLWLYSAGHVEPLKHCKWVSGMIKFLFTWELVRNAESQAPFLAYCISLHFDRTFMHSED